MNIEPFGYFRAEPFGWTDCKKGDDGAMPLFDGAVIMDLQQQLATESASLFAESQRKQQLEGQVAELVGVLERIISACDACAADDSKSLVDEFTDEMEAEARAAIQKVRGGE